MKRTELLLFAVLMQMLSLFAVARQCLWIQKFKILDDKSAIDETKAVSVLKDGLGELARLNKQARPGSPGRHHEEEAALYNKIQHYFIEKTRLGIPGCCMKQGVVL